MDQLAVMGWSISLFAGVRRSAVYGLKHCNAGRAVIGHDKGRADTAVHPALKGRAG